MPETRPTAPIVEIRWLTSEDSLEELTDLLHSAYMRLGDMGLNYTAVDQSVEVTRERVESGECFVASDAERLLGTIMFLPSASVMHSPWYDRDDVCGLGQFAVWPELQRTGIGGQLMDAVEDRAAREPGITEIALDTAEPATHLVEWYSRRGYRFIEYVKWGEKTYRSLIMSKPTKRA